MKYLSPESLDLLKRLNNGFTLKPDPDDQRTCIDQLVEYGFIKSKITGYILEGTSPVPELSDYVITEVGKAYLVQYEHEVLTIESLKSLAESAVKQAELAQKSSEDAKASAKKAKSEAFGSKVCTAISFLLVLLQTFWPDLREYLVTIFQK